MSLPTRQAHVLWLNAPLWLEFKLQPLGIIEDDHVYCETLVTAISPGTELAAYKGLEPLRAGSQYPRLQGYCNVAEVMETGSKVTLVKPGDRVLTFQSHRTAFLVKSSDILYVLRKDQDARKIVCAYLYHLGYNAVLRSGVKAGSQVLIVGMGTLGTTSLQICQIAGAITDVLTDQPSGRQLSRELGARNVNSRTDFDRLSASGEQPHHDVVITTVNGWNDWKRGLMAARKHGIIVMLGFPGRGEPKPDFNPLDPQYLYSKQLRIESVGESPEQLDSRGFLRFNERANLSFIIDCIDRGVIDTSRIASTNFHYPDIEEAYRSLNERTSSTITALIEWRQQ